MTTSAVEAKKEIQKEVLNLKQVTDLFKVVLTPVDQDAMALVFV